MPPSWSVAWTALHGTVPALLPLLGRHRLTQDEVAQSPMRKRILDLVRQHPGILVSQLRRDSGLGWGAFYHHLARLREEGLLGIRRVGPRRLAFIPHVAEEMDAARLAALGHPTARKVAHAVLRAPGTSIREVVQETGESPRVVYYHVRQLLKAGVIRSGSRTRHVDLRPADHLKVILRDAEEAPDDEE
jgi:DNA-binding transcriptional ArsR family regulator